MAPKKPIKNLSKKGVSKKAAGSVKGGSLSNWSKTRNDISQSMARNLKA